MVVPPKSKEERNAHISTILRQVDEDVKARRFDEALEKVRRVYDFDIKNIYARAYEERILSMKIEKERDAAMLEVEKRAVEKADEEITRRLKDFYRQQEAEAQKRRVLDQQEQDLEKRARKASVNEVQQVATKDISAIESDAVRRIEDLERRLTAQLQSTLHTTTAPSSTAAMEQMKVEYEEKITRLQTQFEAADVERKKIQEETFLKLKEEQKRTQDELSLTFEQERHAALDLASAKAKEQSVEAYRAVMFLMMQFNLTREVQAPILQTLKISLSISDSEHLEIERAVQVNAYIEVVRATWQRGTPTEDDRAMLANVQQLYRIPDEEHALITKRVKRDLGLPDDTAVVYVIDDDPSIRKYVEHIFKKTYSTVITAASAEEALRSTETNPPSLILSDINLGPGVMSGFSFYEKIRAGVFGDALRDVPCVLMSAMEDEFFIRTAKQMGVKAFLPKPFTREILESTIRTALA